MERSLYLYFAHLKTQLVKRSAWVNPGDTIGTVGNSGNAIRTRPHLPFGVYINGSVPESFDLLETPERKGILITSLTADIRFEVLGRYKEYYFIRTQQGIEGWMSISGDPLI